jgi:hypothetical protein
LLSCQSFDSELFQQSTCLPAAVAAAAAAAANIRSALSLSRSSFSLRKLMTLRARALVLGREKRRHA